MRTHHAIFFAAVATLAIVAEPALARNSDAQKATEKSTSSAECHAYEMAPDGSWTALPCEAVGASNQTRQQPPPRNPEQGAH